MNYLSCYKPTLDNFTLLAQKNVVMTKEYAQTLEEIKKERFSAKIEVLKITMIAFIALGAWVAAIISNSLGILIATTAIFPYAGIRYHRDRQTTLRLQLDQNQDDLNVIFNRMILHLERSRTSKEDLLIDVFNAVSMRGCVHKNKVKAHDQLKLYSDQFDTGKIEFIYTKHVGASQKHAKLIPLTKLILARKHPSTISDDQWKKLQRTCHTFLYGQGSIESTISGEQWSDNTLYVKLEKEKKPPFRWKAVKYG